MYVSKHHQRRSDSGTSISFYLNELSKIYQISKKCALEGTPALKGLKSVKYEKYLCYTTELMKIFPPKISIFLKLNLKNKTFLPHEKTY